MSPPGRRPLPDAEDRRLAATVFDRNLVVTAGAGTGKTALLVERVLNLIGSGRERIDTLAAITFTEKAAAELRQRLARGLDALQRLAAAGAGPSAAGSGDEAGRSWLWLREGGGDPGEVCLRARRALTDLDSASISTIHAFCAEMLRRHPEQAGVDPAFSPDEGQAFTLTFDQEWERFLLDEVGRNPGRAETWGRVLGIPEALEEIRATGLRMALLGLDGDHSSGGGTATKLMDGAASHLREKVTEVLRGTADRNPNMTTFLSAAAQLLAGFLDGGAEAMAATATPMSLDAFIKKSVPAPGKSMKGLPPSQVTATAKQAQWVIRLLAHIDEERVHAIVEAAGPLAARARARYLAAGYVSFDMLLQIARDLLARHPHVRAGLGSRFGALLVDEFQDTDPMQYEILFHLTGDGRGGLRPGSLFIVGDPKQSIYRFRGADMEAYRRAVRRVLDAGGLELKLSASFRSPDQIVEPVNLLFQSVMSPEAGEDLSWGVPYEPIVSAEGPAPSGSAGAEIWSVPTTGKVEAGRQNEADAIAGWISSQSGERRATGEPLRLKDVAILLRALTNAGLYAHALRRAGIPYVVEGGRGFYERPEVSDLLSFLRAALNPWDGPAVLAVMRSPVGGVSDVELARFAAAGGRLDGSGTAPADGAFPGIRRAFDLLEAFRGRFHGLAVEEVVEAALRETNLALLHAAAWEGPQRVANLGKIASRAGEIARRGLSLEETLELIEREYREEAAHGEAPLADETVDAVRILSVHKAKGLEYPVVIVPDLGRMESRGERPGGEATLASGAEERHLAVRLAGGQINTAMAWHTLMERWHGRAEEKRVFYVACTRASRRLILVNSVAGRGSSPWRDALACLGYSCEEGYPGPGALAGGLVRHRVPAISPPRREEAAPEKDPRWREAAGSFRAAAGAVASRLEPLFRFPSGAGDARVAAGPSESDPPEPPRPAAEASPREIGRLAGIAVHRALEAWDFVGDGSLLELAGGAAIRAARSEGRHGDEAVLEAIRSEVEAILTPFLRSDLRARLSELHARAPGLMREVPVMRKARGGDGTEMWLGAADVIYRDADGTWVVADYKTGPLRGEPSEAARRHREQLEIYVRALRDVLPGEKVRAEILFVRDGISAPVEIPGE